MKNNTYTKDDLLFKKVNKILKEASFKYWVCHGTLLGLVRDDMLLPWDSDIDFAVWKDDVSIEEIEILFKKHGFKQEYVFGEMDCLHFYTKGKKVDVSFYEKQKGVSSIKWIAPSKKLKNRIFNFIAEKLCSPDGVLEVEKDFTTIFSSVKYLLIQLLLLIKPLFSIKFRNIIYNYVKKDFIYTGYSYPDELMQFKIVQFLGEDVPIPINSEECLKLTYGKDWKVPKKEYVWYDEADNLVDLKVD